ncbi:galactose-3-O-sulfotransferase 3-like [Argopecten irradians]|uniref:galactose-3-O-sulfotransferase 3-like n=1 Tax=Argopecten irradians TaxID=31199 RepID=UPI00371B1B88
MGSPKRYLNLMLLGCCLLFTWYSIRRSDRVNGRKTIPKQNFNTYGLPFRLSKYNVTGDPVDHIAFIKLPKAGSTTAQNIFLRYGDEKNLTFALPSNPRRGGGETLTKKFFFPPPRNGNYDITCAHTKYNRKQFSTVLHKDTKYIGTVREPFSHFQSSIRFKKPKNIVGIKGENPVLEYLKTELKNRNSINRYSITCNYMSDYYLFPRDLFALDNESELQKHLQKFGNEMDMILVLEYLDESVVLMRRILNWDLRHVLYAQLRVNKEHDPRLKFGPEEAKLHKTVLI